MMPEDKKPKYPHWLPPAIITASAMWWIMKLEWPDNDGLMDVITLTVLLVAAIYLLTPFMTDFKHGVGHVIRHFFARFYAEWERIRGARERA